MARKANATVAASPATSPATAPTSVVAQPQDNRPAVTKPLSLAARAKAMGAASAAPETQSKSKVPVVKAPPEIAGLINLYVEAGSRKDAADGEMKIYGGQIRPAAENLRITEARKAGSVFKSIDLDGMMTYTWPDLKVGKIDNGPAPEQGTKNAETYKAGLRAVFGDANYEKYFVECDTLVLKPEVYQNPEMGDRLFRLLSGDRAVIQPTDKGNNVALLFNSEPWVEMKKVNKTGLLQTDMTLEPKIEALVDIAVNAGWLQGGNGRLCSKKAATAAAVQSIAAAASNGNAATQITINPAK